MNHPYVEPAASPEDLAFVRRLLPMQKRAAILRAQRQALQKHDPRILHTAVMGIFQDPKEGGFSDEELSSCWVRIITQSGGSVREQVQRNKGANARNPSINRPDVPSAVTTLTGNLVDASVAEIVDATNAILLMLDNWLSSRLQHIKKIIAFDEFELRIWGRVQGAREDRDVDHYTRHAVATCKPDDNLPNDVLRFHIGVSAWPSLNLKIPNYVSPNSFVDPHDNARFTSLPSKADLVDGFLKQVARLDVQPSWIYMDRGFAAWHAFERCLRYKRQQEVRGWPLDFVLPLPAWGKDRAEFPAIGLMKKSGRRGYIENAPSIKELLHRADLPMREMTGAPLWKYRQFVPNETGGPYVPEGFVMLIVRAPKTGEQSSNVVEHADGTFTFANLCTKPVTGPTAYGIVHNYFLRNYVEAQIWHYKYASRMTESPSYTKRLITVMMSILSLAIFAVFREQRCSQLNDWRHEVYDLPYFFGQTGPDLVVGKPPG